MREKMKQRIVQYVVLMAGILALLSVVIPHHHHRDGMPCYQSLTAEQAHGDKSTDTHDCGCDGHNLAYFSTHISHFMDGDVDIHLMPLLVLFDYIYPPEPAFCGQLLDHENAPYIESLHDTWIVPRDFVPLLCLDTSFVRAGEDRLAPIYLLLTISRFFTQ